MLVGGDLAVDDGGGLALEVADGQAPVAGGGIGAFGVGLGVGGGDGLVIGRINGAGSGLLVDAGTR